MESAAPPRAPPRGRPPGVRPSSPGGSPWAPLEAGEAASSAAAAAGEPAVAASPPGAASNGEGGGSEGAAWREDCAPPPPLLAAGGAAPVSRTATGLGGGISMSMALPPWNRGGPDDEEAGWLRASPALVGVSKEVRGCATGVSGGSGGPSWPPWWGRGPFFGFAPRGMGLDAQESAGVRGGAAPPRFGLAPFGISDVGDPGCRGRHGGGIDVRGEAGGKPAAAAAPSPAAEEDEEVHGGKRGAFAGGSPLAAGPSKPRLSGGFRSSASMTMILGTTAAPGAWGGNDRDRCSVSFRFRRASRSGFLRGRPRPTGPKPALPVMVSMKDPDDSSPAAPAVAMPVKAEAALAPKASPERYRWSEVFFTGPRQMVPWGFGAHNGRMDVCRGSSSIALSRATRRRFTSRQ